MAINIVTSVGILWALGTGQIEIRPGKETAAAYQIRSVSQEAIGLASRWGKVPPVLITIHDSHEALERATGQIGRPLTRAWARPGRIDIQSPRTWTSANVTDKMMLTLLAHELTHCVLFNVLNKTKQINIPLWFIEGMAVYKTKTGTPEYDKAGCMFEFLVYRFGQDTIRGFISSLGDTDFYDAFFDMTGVTVTEFEDITSRCTM